MRQRQDDTVLPVKAGLCAECEHASVKDTKRGTTYLRCTRAEWDGRLVRYPTLPVTDCVGYEPVGAAAGQAPANDPGVPGPRRADDLRLA
jgi:hypothetical protein